MQPTKEILDTLGMVECREMAWARLIMGEITQEAIEEQYLIDQGKFEAWRLAHMLEEHVLKMDMVCTFLFCIENALKKAMELARMESEVTGNVKPA